MSATGLAEVLSRDCFEIEFRRIYGQKDFMRDASRLKALASLRTHQALTASELAEVVELRRRLKRADADTAMLLVIESRLKGGYSFF